MEEESPSYSALRVVLPGDEVVEVPLDSETDGQKNVVVLGPGLRREGEKVFATRAGVLR